MKYAHINENNIVQGWYDSEIHEEIPTPNIKVTNGQWQIAIDNNHNKVDGYGNTSFVDLRTDIEIILEEKKIALSKAKKYLDSTDWYVVRKLERNIDIPSDISIGRANAIDLINELERAD